MSQHPHRNIPPHPFPTIRPHPILCVYIEPLLPCMHLIKFQTSLHIPSLVYLHIPSSKPYSSVFNDCSSKRMSEHKSKSRNRWSTEQNRKMKHVLSRREKENQDRDLVSGDGSYEEQVHHKEVSDLLSQKLPPSI